MHELAIAEALADIAEREASAAGATHVRRVHCRVGVLRQISAEALHEAFRIAAAGTCCDSADLIVETIPLRGLCPTCQTEFRIDEWRWACPRCGQPGRPLPGGDELELTALDVEDAS
jgi:hydrogenase nickel incorporation protein HypA/HybF